MLHDSVNSWLDMTDLTTRIVESAQAWWLWPETGFKTEVVGNFEYFILEKSVLKLFTPYCWVKSHLPTTTVLKPVSGCNFQVWICFKNRGLPKGTTDRLCDWITLYKCHFSVRERASAASVGNHLLPAYLRELLPDAHEIRSTRWNVNSCSRIWNFVWAM